jgi:EAL domain-containing protein (putative c-di-GMP-specific phosphodiesterase class I)
MPDGSFRSPGEFLAVAEESGLIVEISDWVLRTAICTAARWYRGGWPNARVAINVSPRQFLDYRFVSRLEGLLREYELPARCLELELTESVLQTGSHTIKTLDHLRTIGVAIALDDFGTGYSSLASLQQLPLTRVKLDRSLIAAIDDSARSASIARATIALCRGLGLEVTAEGVERVEQLAMLLPHPALTLQGYLISRPVSASNLLPLLAHLPAHCLELRQAAERLPAQTQLVSRAGERRRGKLSLVGD